MSCVTVAPQYGWLLPFGGGLSHVGRTMLSGGFDIVHSVLDYYDGPRSGVADFGGVPHVYECDWSDEADDYSDIYLLVPLPEEVFKLALEDWAIWRRWEAAFHRGEASQETHPALPQDRERHTELQNRLAPFMKVDSRECFRAKASFEVRTDCPQPEKGMRNLKVKWTPE